jgi:Flp pilus assembly protein TadG
VSHLRVRLSRPRLKSRRDEGLMAVELAILVPLVIVMLLVVVAFGRVTQGRAMVDQAAAAAARTASLAATPSQATADAIREALATLAGAGLSCQGASVSVDTSAFRPGGQVTARVVCTVDLSQMAMAGVPGALTLTASATSPLEDYRDFGGAP